MNAVFKLTAAAAALASLAACDALGLNRNESASGNAAATNTVATNTADANAAAPAGGKDPLAGGGATPASAPFTGQVTTAFLIGRWTDTGDCTNVIEFRDDGSFILADGRTGYWTLNGDRLTFQGGTPVTSQVSAPNPDTIMLTHANGTVGRSTRC